MTVYVDVEGSRIGNACWYQQGKSDEWKGGKLLAWSIDYEDTGNGPGHFPVGLIEDEKTGKVHSVSTHFICFASIPPNVQD